MIELLPVNDCNSKELSRLLVGAIQTLINIGQWNDFTRHQAVSDPYKFMTEVEKHSDNILKENESINCICSIMITGYTVNNKIFPIKAFRELYGLGLAAAKDMVEAIPSYNAAGLQVHGGKPFTSPFKFTSKPHALDSHEYKLLANPDLGLKIELFPLIKEKVKID